MSEKVAIVVATDSAACLPPELVERYAIRVIPLNIEMEGTVYLDGVDITPNDVYEALKQGAWLPTTSAPSPGELAKVYQELSWARGILCITLSSTFSMMFNAAQQAKEIAKEALRGTEVVVLDSCTAAGTQGFMVLAAAQAAASGEMSLVEVTRTAQELGPRLNLIATFDTLRYLARGGRIGRAASWAVSVLNIKPIIHVLDGEVAPLEKPRTRARALGRLLEIMEDRVAEKPVHVNIHHAAVPDEVEPRVQVMARY